MRLLPINQLLACILGLFLFFGCKSDTKTNSDSDSAVIVEPELITSRIRANPDFFCPYQSLRAYTLSIMDFCWLKLVQRDRKTLEVIPMLAKDVPTPELITDGELAGGYKLTYEILKDANWDNGTPITGYDYLATMKIVNNPAGTRYLPLFREFMNYYHDIVVDEKNPKKFTIYTNRPYYKLIDDTGYYVLPAYAYDPQHVLKDFTFKELTDPDKFEELKNNEALKSLNSQFSSTQTTQEVANLIGNGPYKITEWNQNVDVTITKKENWWGKKYASTRPDFVANAKSIRFEILPDENAAIAKVKNGELDIVTTITGTAFEDLKKNDFVNEQYEFHTAPTLSSNIFGINCKRAKLSDKMVRQALSCLIDRATLNQEVYQGHAQLTYGPLPPSYHNSLIDDTYGYNIEKARKLLSEAGWEDTNGNGTRDKIIDGKLEEMVLTFLSTSSNRITTQMLLLIQDDFKKGGIGIERVTLEARQFSAARSRGEFDIFTAGATLAGDSYGVRQFWHTESQGNYNGAGNASLDKKIEEIERTLDEKELGRLMTNFQKELNEEQFTIFVNCPKERMLFNKRLKNHHVTIRRPNFQANRPHL